jgi:hypothetical protein
MVLQMDFKLVESKQLRETAGSRPTHTNYITETPTRQKIEP